MNLEQLYEREAELVKLIIEREQKGGIDIHGRVDLYELRREIQQAKRMVRV